MVPSDKDSRLNSEGRCELCARAVGANRLTRHHLLPRSRARKMKRRRKGRQELKRRSPGKTVALCGPCHRNVHVSIGNAELQRGYDSVEALRDHPGVRRFTEWVKDKPHGNACVLACKSLENRARIACKRQLAGSAGRRRRAPVATMGQLPFAVRVGSEGEVKLPLSAWARTG